MSQSPVIRQDYEYVDRVGHAGLTAGGKPEQSEKQAVERRAE